MFALSRKDIQDLITLTDSNVQRVTKDYFSAGDHFGLTKEDIEAAKALRDKFVGLDMAAQATGAESVTLRVEYNES